MGFVLGLIPTMRRLLIAFSVQPQSGSASLRFLDRPWKSGAKYRLVWPEANFLEQSIGMPESQDASVSVLWGGDGLEPKVGELCGDFSSALRGFGFNHEGVRAPSHNGDVSSIAKFAGGIEPPWTLGPGEERHRGSIRSPRLKG